MNHRHRDRLPLPLVLLTLLFALAAGCLGTMPPDEATSSTQQQVIGCPSGQTLATFQRGAVSPGAVIEAGINSASPAANYGSNTAVNAKSTRDILIRFDVSTLPAGAVVQSATMGLTNGLAPTAGTVTIAENNATWIESGAGSVTWTTAPTYGLTIASQGNSGAAGSAFSVTLPNSVVQGWVTGANNGLRLFESTGATNVYASEWPTTSQRPRLDICFNVVTPHCGNGVKDADESDVDCGGASCVRCADGLLCGATPDCLGVGHFCESWDGRCHPTGGAYATPIASCTIPLATPSQYTVTTVAFGPDPLQQADLYMPFPVPASPPKVVFIGRGSAFRTGDKTNPINVHAAQAAIAIGKAAFVPNYRLSTPTVDGINEEESDMRCALRTLRAQTSVDGVHVAGAFMSAGGTLGGMAIWGPTVGPTAAGQSLDDGTCTIAPSIADVPTTQNVFFYTPFYLDATPFGSGTPDVAQYVGATAGNPAFYSITSLNSPGSIGIHYGQPGGLLVYGTADTVIDPSLQDGPFASLLNQHGIASTVIAVAGLPHGFDITNANVGTCTAWSSPAGVLAQ